VSFAATGFVIRLTGIVTPLKLPMICCEEGPSRTPLDRNLKCARTPSRVRRRSTSGELTSPYLVWTTPSSCEILPRASTTRRSGLGACRSPRTWTRSKRTTMSDGIDPHVPDDRLPHGGRPVRPCEFDRAYADLVAPRSRHARAPVSACSPEDPEERPFPPSPPGSRAYSLCNGHLRDLFADLEEGRSAGSPA